MKATTALHIAEHLWADTVQPGSLFDTMMKNTKEMEELVRTGKITELNSKVSAIQSEIVARWANIIMEVEGHSEQDGIHRG